MGKVGPKQTKKRSTKTDKSAGVKKSAVLKGKAKVNSKQTKAQIEKLNQDLSTISSIHAAILAQGLPPKEVNALDVKRLREDMEKDNQTKLQSEKAEKDLASQLELITGMAL